LFPVVAVTGDNLGGHRTGKPGGGRNFDGGRKQGTEKNENTLPWGFWEPSRPTNSAARTKGGKTAGKSVVASRPQRPKNFQATDREGKGVAGFPVSVKTVAKEKTAKASGVGFRLGKKPPRYTYVRYCKKGHARRRQKQKKQHGSFGKPGGLTRSVYRGDKQDALQPTKLVQARSWRSMGGNPSVKRLWRLQQKDQKIQGSEAPQTRGKGEKTFLIPQLA